MVYYKIRYTVYNISSACIQLIWKFATLLLLLWISGMDTHTIAHTKYNHPLLKKYSGISLNVHPWIGNNLFTLDYYSTPKLNN